MENELGALWRVSVSSFLESTGGGVLPFLCISKYQRLVVFSGCFLWLIQVILGSPSSDCVFVSEGTELIQLLDLFHSLSSSQMSPRMPSWWIGSN